MREVRDRHIRPLADAEQGPLRATPRPDGQRGEPLGGLRERSPLPRRRGAHDQDRGRGHERERSRRRSSSVPAAGWGEAMSRDMAGRSCRMKQRNEEPMWSVRERLSARAGRTHFMRSVRKAASSAGAPDLGLPDSDDEAILPRVHRERKSRRKDRSRRKRGRDSRSRSRSRRSSSSDSLQPFRGPPSSTTTAGRSQCQAGEEPHVVLIDTMSSMSRALPRSAEGRHWIEVTSSSVFLPSSWLGFGWYWSCT